MELIGRFGLKERIIISSFNHLSALSGKDFMPDMKTGALVGNGGIANAGYYCKKFGFECYHPGVEGLTKGKEVGAGLSRLLGLVNLSNT